MAAKSPKKPAKRRTTARARSVARQAFEDGVVSRGEAAPAGEPLGPGATHEIVSTDAAGKPVLKRRRFSLS